MVQFVVLVLYFITNFRKNFDEFILNIFYLSNKYYVLAIICNNVVLKNNIVVILYYCRPSCFNKSADGFSPVRITLIQFMISTVANLVCADDVCSAQTNLLLTTPMTLSLPVAGSDQRSGPPEST